MLFISVFTFYSVFSQTKSENIVQIAILLDTSSSMSGLINQAKSQIWKIVNELSLGKRNGETPSIEVALYEYGKDSLSKKSGFIRKIVNLTTDLDLLSDELFKLKTYGGQEYCGMVIEKAVNQLEWKKSNNTLKIIIIAGNEPFNQGSVSYKKSAKYAISKGIIINTIFCGNNRQGIRTYWQDGANLADGSYMSINHNKKYTYIKAPQDDEIIRLGNELNKTYISYGLEGRQKKEMQKKQDINAKTAGESSIVQRTITKSKRQYNNKKWDLVDAVNDEEINLNIISKTKLPSIMRNMSKAERKKYIENLKIKRKKIQEKIKKLNIERKKFLKNKIKNNKNTFDSAIIKVIKKQASLKKYKF